MTINTKAIIALITALLTWAFGPKINGVNTSVIGQAVATPLGAFLTGFHSTKLIATVISRAKRTYPRPVRPPRPLANITMFDAVTLSNIQPWRRKLRRGQRWAIAGYTAGRFRNYHLIRALFPAVQHVFGITPTSDVVSDCLDIEPGNEGPAAAGPWVTKATPHVNRPALYCDRADFPAVIASVKAERIPRTAVRYLIAHPDGVPHICTPERCGVPIPPDGTQYLFAGTVDVSLLRGDFFQLPTER